MTNKWSKTAIFALFTVVIIVASMNTQHTYDTATGAQNYVRNVLGIKVGALSETEYMECKSWVTATDSDQRTLILEKCWLVFGCKEYEKNRATFSQSCGNT